MKLFYQISKTMRINLIIKAESVTCALKNLCGMEDKERRRQRKPK